MPRREFSVRVRAKAAARSGGICERHLWREGEGCAGRAAHFDHVIPDGLGGPATLENCAHLCVRCHREKTTSDDTPRMRKADAQRQHVVFRIKPAGRKLQSRGFQKAPGKAPRGPRKRVLPPLALYRPRDD